MLQYRYAALTDVGKLRANNEDAVLLDPEHGLVALADGMGGYNAGEVASALAVDLFVGEMSRWLRETADVDVTSAQVRRAMEICVDGANRAVFDAAHSFAEFAGMGTTLAVAVCRPEACWVGHVGDSRIYRWRDHSLQQITRDHSLLQEQLDSGLINPREAAQADYRNLVTRALGVEDMVLLDVQTLEPQAGDVLLLCSDGLNDMATDADLAEVMAAGASLEETCQHLVDMANQRGGRDNISVALVEVLMPQRRAGVISKLLRF